MTTLMMSIANPLVPIGKTIQISASGGSQKQQWSVSSPASVTIDDPYSLTPTFEVTNMATAGVAVTIRVDDSAGNWETTMLIPAPAGTLSHHNILIYGMTGPSSSIVGLLAKESGIFTPLTATPGIITDVVLTLAKPLHQVLPEANATFVSCYVLNLAELSDWQPA